MRFFTNLFLFSITWVTVIAADNIYFLTSRELILIPLVSALVTGILTFIAIGVYIWIMNKKRAKMLVFKTAEPIVETKAKEKPPTNDLVIDSTSNAESKKTEEPANEMDFQFQPVAPAESHAAAPMSTNLCSLPVEPLDGKEKIFKQ